MRVLLFSYNVHTEATSGAARSVRTMVEWLAADGHACHVLSTAVFEASPAGTSLVGHLAGLGVVPCLRHVLGPCPVYDYAVAGVAVTTVGTSTYPPATDPRETAQYLACFTDLLDLFRPDRVLTYGGHPVLQDALRAARARGIATIVTLRGYGYEDPGWFRHADAVLTCSAFLSAHYAGRIGLSSTALPTPMVAGDVLASETNRRFVTFVHPAPHKGVALFARLAAMLTEARAEIPLLVVESRMTTASPTETPIIDFARQPQIRVSPPLPRPRDIFALTRILLVPSLFAEPSGRVAAEAVHNGIPALVSDRGGLAETVAEGGIVLPVPAWMAAGETRLPAAAEIRPWFDAVVSLWDNPAYYASVSAAARAVAERMYDDARLRARYRDFFAGVRPGRADMSIPLPNPARNAL